jgi:hypothetical protein
MPPKGVKDGSEGHVTQQNNEENTYIYVGKVKKNKVKLSL